ncbi:IPT/TIG domain-containing protein [Actinoplanes sp. NPDC024001]|uniref:IPT/TIG domain-containing protein n=1 Tax=Actinoplanes sp. NPDC024001 TaxID=3154598 RepID=UPI0033E20CDD
MRSTRRAVLASLMATVLVLAGLSAPASAAPMGMTLSPAYGPAGGGNTVVGSITPNTAVPSPFPAGATPTVQFQYFGSGSASCSTRARANAAIDGTSTTLTAGVFTATPATVKRVTSWKIVFNVPAVPLSFTNSQAQQVQQIQSKWHVCAYDTDNTSTSVLLATALYTVALKPTITAITPDSSPAAGGQPITVTGTGFTAVTAPITASIGDVPLTDIKVGANGTSFTATTAPRAAGGNLELSVVAPGGTVNSADPDNDANTNNPIYFTYSNGITVSPNNAAANTQLVTVEVAGAGFSQLDFETVVDPTSSKAHVFLVNGAYNSVSNRNAAECMVKVVVSDTQFVCDLDLTGVVEDAYVLTVVDDGSIGAPNNGNPSIISSGAAFIVGPY